MTLMKGSGSATQGVEEGDERVEPAHERRMVREDVEGMTMTPEGHVERAAR